MDPDQILKELSEQIRLLWRGKGEHSIDKLVMAFDDLDLHLTSGGHLPARWKNAAGADHWQAVLKSTNHRAATNAVRSAFLPVVEHIERTLENYPPQEGPTWS